MTYALSKFISIPTVSSDPAHREDCRQGAIWLKKCLSQLGAETSLVRSHSLFPSLMMGANVPLVTDGRGKPTRISYISGYPIQIQHPSPNPLLRPLRRHIRPIADLVYRPLHPHRSERLPLRTWSDR